MTETEFKAYRKQAKQAAITLYGKSVAERIGKATTEGEVSRILTTARHNMPD